MKIVNRYLIKNFLGPFILAFSVALFVLLMQFLWKWVDELVGKGLEIGILLKMMFYASLTLTSMAFPLAVLLASLMTYGNMGEHYEVVALKSAGISTQQMMRPLAVLSLIIAVVAYVFSNNVIPRATVKLKTVLYSIQEQKPTMNIDEGVFYTGFDNYAIRVGKKNHGNERIEDILIYDHSHHNGNTTVTRAKSGIMQMTPDKRYLLFTLYDGSYWDENASYGGSGRNNDYYPLTRSTFTKEYKRFDMTDFEIAKADENMYEAHPKTMSSKDLTDRIDAMKNEIKSLSHEASNVFFGNLYYFNAVVRHDSTFDTLTAVKRCDVSAVSPQQQASILQYADNSARSFIYSVRFAFEDILNRSKYMWSFEIEYFRKFTLSLACVLFFFIGAPLGSIIRKGGIGMPLVITVVFFSLYFALSITGEKIAKNSLLPVWFGMGLSSFVLIPIGILLTWQATSDADSLSPETYSKLIQKIKNIKFFSKKTP